MRPPHRGDRRQGGRKPRDEKVDPLLKVEWCRVLDHPDAGGALAVLTEPNLHIIRIRSKSGTGQQQSGARLYMGVDHSQRDIVSDVLGFARIRDLSATTNFQLPVIIQQYIEDSPEVFIQQFFNRAGNLSLKMHAFELLQGVGNKKAQEMVQARGRTGWNDFASLNEVCGINASELLAKRFVSEIQDRGLQPRLIDLLCRQDE